MELSLKFNSHIHKCPNQDLDHLTKITEIELCLRTLNTKNSSKEFSGLNSPILSGRTGEMRDL
jgi:hypothetical protein